MKIGRNTLFGFFAGAVAVVCLGLTTMDGLRVGPDGTAGRANITAILSASATLDFGSNFVAGAGADLPITVAGAAAGDFVNVGIPSGAPPQGGCAFSGFASNGVVYVRCAYVAASQDPASGTFKVTIIKTQ